LEITGRPDFGVDAAQDDGLTVKLEVQTLEQERRRGEQYAVSPEQARMAGGQSPEVFDQIDRSSSSVGRRVCFDIRSEGVDAYDAPRGKFWESKCILVPDSGIEEGSTIVCLDLSNRAKRTSGGNLGERAGMV